jgi:hypothetical protein
MLQEEWYPETSDSVSKRKRKEKECNTVSDSIFSWEVSMQETHGYVWTAERLPSLLSNQHVLYVEQE